MLKIILKGYYGFGNLGDDILLLICSKWIKEVFPNSTLVVSTAGSSSSYIKKLTGNRIDKIIPISPEIQADLIIHGGGGTYFDFDTGTSFFLVLNKLIGRIGLNNFGSLLRFYRRMKGWPSNQNTIRVALGIGTGRFMDGSKKYFQKSAELAGFHLIVVRDDQSYDDLLSKNLKATIWNATDLAFLDNYWQLSNKSAMESSGKNIGFVLRKWEHDPSYLQIVHNLARQLESDGYIISIFIFEKERDQEIVSMFNHFTQYVWKPETLDLSDYIKNLKKQDVLISSRAHGTIVGAALGIPTVCIGIEPKLKNFHSMLPNSSVYVEPPLSIHKLTESFYSALAISSELVRSDFQDQNRRITGTMEMVKKWLEKTINHHQTSI